MPRPSPTTQPFRAAATVAKAPDRSSPIVGASAQTKCVRAPHVGPATPGRGPIRARHTAGQSHPQRGEERSIMAQGQPRVGRWEWIQRRDALNRLVELNRVKRLMVKACLEWKLLVG